MNKKLALSLLILVVMSAVYRIIPNRPMGFAPQIAIALFSGSIFMSNKKWAFCLPLLSMFISDLLYQILYINHMTTIQGFYGGQWINYLLIGSIALLGFSSSTSSKLLSGMMLAPTYYFLISNFIVFISGGGYHRSTLFECYIDSLPFYVNSVCATLVFGMILFGSYKIISPKILKHA
jgi:hypothetical protein